MTHTENKLGFLKSQNHSEKSQSLLFLTVFFTSFGNRLDCKCYTAAFLVDSDDRRVQNSIPRLLIRVDNFQCLAISL